MTGIVILAVTIIAAAWTGATWADHHIGAGIAATAAALDPQDTVLAADLAAAMARHPSAGRARIDLRA